MKRLLILLVACGRPPTAANEPKPDTSKCPNVADQMVSFLSKGKETGGEPFMEAQDRIRRLVLTRCRDDAWGLEAQQCFLGLASIEQANDCATFLTIDQREALAQGIDEAFPRDGQK